MNTNTATLTEVRFTAKRACYWNHTGWTTISQATAREWLALGTAIELKAGEWI